MKNWVYILILLPLPALAGESAVGNFLGKMFPATTQNVNSTVDAIKAPATGEYLGNAITNQLAPAYPQQQYPQGLPQQGYPQQGYPQQGYPAATQPYQQMPQAAPAQDPTQTENIVRCMRMGSLIELHTALSDQSNESQAIVSRSKPLYASLKCNDVLNAYSPLIKQVDQAVKACAEDEECQTAKLPARTAGNVQK